MRKIAQNFKGSLLQMILGPLMKLFEAVLELFVPLIMADIIDNGIRTGNTSHVFRGGINLIVIALLSVAAAMVCQYFAALAAGRFGQNLRTQLYRHVLTLSSKDVAHFGTGGLITRLTNDTNQIQSGLNLVIRIATRVPFLAIGSIIMALRINLRIGLIFLLVTPLIVLVIVLVMKRSLPSYARIQAGQDKLSRISGENLDGMRVIRAFARQKQEKEDFSLAAEELTEITVRVGKISAALNPLTTLIINFAIIAIVWFGAKFAFAGSLKPGEIVALVSYMNQTLFTLIVAVNLVIAFTRGLTSARRIAQVLNTSPSVTYGNGAAPFASAPVLEMQNISFAYHTAAENAVEDISFVIQAGQTVGIIGGTGSGKSTLINLIARYYNPGSGALLLNGVPIQNWKLSDLQKKIAIVPQRAALFTGTIRHNLQISGSNVNDEVLWGVLKTAQAADFVNKLPQKLDSAIAEGGKNLSGGQRQRLTIARALAKNPEILILDDSSSALDYATDAALRKALKEDALQNKSARTTIIISQRASTIKNADMILVMDDGHVVGSGKHEELLHSNNVYHEICDSQGIALNEGQVF